MQPKRSILKPPAETHETAANLALLLSPGVGNSSLRHVQAVAREYAVDLWHLLGLEPEETLRALPPGARHIAEILARCASTQTSHAARLINRLDEAGAAVYLADQPGYPEPLVRFLGEKAPGMLIVIGRADLFAAPMAAVVGARDPSPRGAQTARLCAQTFAAAGITVVSGGARGVDRAAHEGALDARGRTIVVLPQGILTCRFPRAYFDAVAAGRCALVSQVPPDTPWETHAAVSRNSTISAFASLVCVIEPKKTGGSIRTAFSALAQGKRVLYYVNEEEPGDPLPGSNAAQIIELLETGGARPLLTQSGKFSTERLGDSWARALVENHTPQSTLFDRRI